MGRTTAATLRGDDGARAELADDPADDPLEEAVKAEASEEVDESLPSPKMPYSGGWRHAVAMAWRCCCHEISRARARPLGLARRPGVAGSAARSACCRGGEGT